MRRNDRRKAGARGIGGQYREDRATALTDCSPRFPVALYWGPVLGVRELREHERRRTQCPACLGARGVALNTVAGQTYEVSYRCPACAYEWVVISDATENPFARLFRTPPDNE